MKFLPAKFLAALKESLHSISKQVLYQMSGASSVPCSTR
jgi:hypothetical protein